MTLSSGDRFSAELNVMRSGTGCVNVGNETISVGPVTCEDGTEVQLKYLGERDLPNMDMSYAICLSQDAIDTKEYSEYLNKIIDILTPDGTPHVGSVTYVRITDIDSDGVGYAAAGESDIVIGPTTADIDDFVQVEIISDTHAKILDKELWGDEYEIRFWILSGQIDKLPIAVEEEYTTAVAEFDNETRICYVKNIPIRVADCDAKLGQKLDIEITEFEAGAAIGEVIEVYDEVVRTNNPGHWARMQWLRDAGFDDPPLHTVAADFIGLSEENLPSDTERLQTALIGEAIRLCLADKAEDSTETYPRAHVTGIHHWITHKLAAIVGDSDDEDEDWFREVLDDGDGPTLTFQGDIIKLSQGYYASGPTRVIPVSEGTYILVSGLPSEYFVKKGLDVELRGLSRAIVDATDADLQAYDLRIQSQEAYVGQAVSEYDQAYLSDFIKGSELSEWQAGDDWEAFVGSQGFGMAWGEDPLEITIGNDSRVSIWREPIEYGMDEYHLRVIEDSEVAGLRVPRGQFKPFSLVIEAVGETPRSVEILETPDSDAVQLASSFSPPRAQYRWLAAIGADFRGFENNRIHWIIPPTTVDSVKTVFERLPVEIRDERTLTASP